MRKLAICASVTSLLLVGLQLTVSAQLSEGEEQVYLYGVYVGYVAAECNAYEQEMIPKSWVLETFTDIGTDKDLDDTYKQALFKFVQEFEGAAKCQVLFKEWAGSSD